MILKSTLPIEILTVISSSVDNGIFEVKSFPIIGDIDREAIVKKAEDYFVKCIRQLRHTENITKDKRESPRLQSWDESASMFFLILDISDYGISRNTSDRLAEIRTRPQRRQTGAQLCKFLTQNSR